MISAPTAVRYGFAGKMCETDIALPCRVRAKREGFKSVFAVGLPRQKLPEAKRHASPRADQPSEARAMERECQKESLLESRLSFLIYFSGLFGSGSVGSQPKPLLE